MFEGYLFDLDGVVVDTAKYHYLAWKELADRMGIPFTELDNERLKGVSRMRSLEIILELGDVALTLEEREQACQEKNACYLTYINKMGADEILPGVRTFIERAKAEHIKIALGSASKNSHLILERLGLSELFDVVIDGTKVTHAKPDPEVFLRGAEALGLLPHTCLVFEDAAAGIEAAHRAGMLAVGVGVRDQLPQADAMIQEFSGLSPQGVFNLLQSRILPPLL